jgi:hypothetical protein
MAETKAAVSAAEEAAYSLVDQVHKLEEENAGLKLRVLELEARIHELEGVRRSSMSKQAAETWHVRRRDAKFDPLDVTPFDDSKAGRKQFSRATKFLEAALLKCCLSRRGSGANDAAAEDGVALTASSLKRMLLLGNLLERVLPPIKEDAQDEDSAFDELLAHTPKSFQAYVRVLRCIKDRLKAALAVFKDGRTKEEHVCYHVLSAGFMPPSVAEGDKTGLRHAVTSMLGVPWSINSVPVRQQKVRDRWDAAHSASAPLAIGEKVDCTAGCGVIEALHPDGSIAIKMDEGFTKTFASQGTLTPLPHATQPLTSYCSECVRGFGWRWSCEACERDVDAACPQRAQ